jgi:glycosyltransferase involved in cell wall biosynthesis
MRAGRVRVVIATNTSWNIVNFRAGLVRALAAAGYEPVAVAPRDPEVAHRLAALGIRGLDVTIQRSGLNPISDFNLVRRYRALFKKVRPAALLSFTIKPNIYGCLAARLLHIPAVPNVSGLGTVFVRGGPLKWLVTRMYRLALRAAPVVFFQNDEDMQTFLTLRIVRADQARRLPGSGVDLNRFALTPLPEGPVTFLLVARLLSDKGIREYVQAARKLSGNRACFQILGPVDYGNPTAIRRDEIDCWVSEGVIQYFPEVEDVRPYIARASVIVLPSYYGEGVPRSLLEGAAMGRPLITTDTAGCRDAVEDGVSGYRCRPRRLDRGETGGAEVELGGDGPLLL